MSGKIFVSLFSVLGSLVFAPVLSAQTTDEETIKIDTRVVFVDTLVKEKRGGQTVSDLKKENFEILADGRKREISYFSRQGSEKRRPLAVVLVLEGRNPGALDSINDAFSELAPEDEVAILASSDGETTILKTLTDFTRDKAKLTEALNAAKNLPVPKKAVWYIDELKEIIGKTQIGSRPNSDVLIVPVGSGLGPLRISERNSISESLIKANVAFSPLIQPFNVGYMKFGKVPTIPVTSGVLKTVGRLTGNDNFAPLNIAAQTGGDVVEIQNKDDYGAALKKLFGTLAARYNLGFTIDEKDIDDGKIHKLEIKVKAQDSKGKKREMIVRSRQFYYVPKAKTN